MWLQNCVPHYGVHTPTYPALPSQATLNVPQDMADLLGDGFDNNPTLNTFPNQLGLFQATV